MQQTEAIGKIAEDHNPWWSDLAARRALSFSARRDLHARLVEHLGLRGGRRAQLIVGPRQVGKTVLLLQLADYLLSHGWPPGNLTYFDFSDDRLIGEISARQVVDLTPVGMSPEQPRIFLLDEVSNAARWAAWLKQAVDRGRDRFIVTDSAASMLRQGTTESGQGRWDEFHLEGLSFAEFLRFLAITGESLEDTVRRVPNAVERYLALGGFPEHVLSVDYYQTRERIRADIADRAIRRDLLRLGVDVERLRALFVYLVQASGAILNVATRGRDVGADPRSVSHWVSLLEDTSLITRLPRHSGSAAASLRSQPRIYASDHGLIAAFTPGGSLDPDQNVRGRAVEAVVYRHLRELARTVPAQLAFFRRNDDLEADFVLDLEGVRTVIEVTAASDPAGRKFNRLIRAGESLKTKRLVMIHGGMVDAVTPPVTSLSLPRFLAKPSLLLEALQ